MKKDNGSLPAFPPALAGVGGGLTKREFIAAMALQALLSNPKVTYENHPPASREYWAVGISVEYADELLEELEKDNAE